MKAVYMRSPMIFVKRILSECPDNIIVVILASKEERRIRPKAKSRCNIFKRKNFLDEYQKMSQHAHFCNCNDPHCPAQDIMRMIKEMPTDGAAWDIENIRGFTMATTAAVKNLPDVVKKICCKMVNDTMTEEQMRPIFESVLRGKDQYGNTVMHYFALRNNDAAIADLLRLGGCMCIRNHAGQSAIDVRKEQKLRMFDEALPLLVGVFNPSTTPTWQIEAIGASAPSEKCETCEQ